MSAEIHGLVTGNSVPIGGKRGVLSTTPLFVLIRRRVTVGHEFDGSVARTWSVARHNHTLTPALWNQPIKCVCQTLTKNFLQKEQSLLPPAPTWANCADWGRWTIDAGMGKYKDSLEQLSSKTCSFRNRSWNQQVSLQSISKVEHGRGRRAPQPRIDKEAGGHETLWTTSSFSCWKQKNDVGWDTTHLLNDRTDI